MIGAPHDDHVLDPAGHVQLAAVQVAEISSPQERAIPVLGQLSPQLALGDLGALPVAVGHVGAADPDLAYLIGVPELARLGFHDPDEDVGMGAATGHDAQRGRTIRDFLHLVASQMLGVHRHHVRGLIVWHRAHLARGLGQPVGGRERAALKPRRGKALREPVHRLGANGLGGGQGDPPMAQVQGVDIGCGDLAGAQLVYEVGAPAVGAPERGHGGKPGAWPLDYVHRR